MKQVLLTALGLLLAMSGHTQASFTQLQDSTVGTALSPDGNYIVGYNRQYYDSRAFFYDAGNKKLTWLTQYDANDLSKAGQVAAVNNDGTAAGVSYDPAHGFTSTDWDGNTTTSPLTIAAYWENGTKNVLPLGDITYDTFQQAGDGTYASAISGNGTIIGGYYNIANMAYFYPIVWRKGTDGTWTLEHLATPNDGDHGRVYAISDDGSIILGLLENPQQGNYGQLVYWKDGEIHKIEQTAFGISADEQYVQMNYASMSPNGRFVALSVNNAGDWVYDITTGTARELPSVENRFLGTDMAVDDNGDVVGALQFGSIWFGGEIYNRPLYYSYADNRLFDLSYYMQFYAPGVTPSITMSEAEKSQAMPFGISADGSVIAGNADTQVTLGQTPKAWQLVLDKSLAVEIPVTPTGLKATTNALGEVTLTWNKDNNNYNGLTLKEYNVYRDSLNAVVVDASADAMKLEQTGVPSGHPSYVVEGVYQRSDGSTVNSPRSEAVTIGLPDTYSLPFFDDFETDGINGQWWSTQSDYASGTDGNWSSVQGNGLNQSTAIDGMVWDQKPYSASIISRPMDATKASNVNMSFAFIYGLVNSENQDLTKDSIAVETTVDNGQTWQTQKDWSVIDMCPQHLWNIISLPLNGVAGKTFKVRFHKHGQGVAAYYPAIDNVKVDTEAEEAAPEGLIGNLGTDGKTFSIAWKNPDGAYQLNYLPAMADGKYAMGNEGNEVIAANKFEPADLKLYHGKYLTAVTNTFNYYTWYPEEKGLHASVVVYEDGKLVREQEMDSCYRNTPTVTVLNEPLQIDSTKELI